MDTSFNTFPPWGASGEATTSTMDTNDSSVVLTPLSPFEFSNSLRFSFDTVNLTKANVAHSEHTNELHSPLPPQLPPIGNDLSRNISTSTASEPDNKDSDGELISPPLSQKLITASSLESITFGSFGSYQDHPNVVDPEQDVYMQLQLTSIYSRKVFVGGLPKSMTASELVTFFSQFGLVSIDWPYRERLTDRPPHGKGNKGYAFAVFTDERSVEKLVERCIHDKGKRYISIGNFSLQIRPWRKQDREYVMPGHDMVKAAQCGRYSVFTGGVNRTATARLIADSIDKLIGDVVMVSIEVDFETDYPKGAARIVFAKEKAYTAAIARRFVKMCAADLLKDDYKEFQIEMKPYLEDCMLCERCRNNSTRLFCAELRCLKYLCDQCWRPFHTRENGEYLTEHRPMLKGLNHRLAVGGHSTMFNTQYGIEFDRRKKELMAMGWEEEDEGDEERRARFQRIFPHLPPPIFPSSRSKVRRGVVDFRPNPYIYGASNLFGAPHHVEFARHAGLLPTPNSVPQMSFGEPPKDYAAPDDARKAAAAAAYAAAHGVFSPYGPPRPISELEAGMFGAPPSYLQHANPFH